MMLVFWTELTIYSPQEGFECKTARRHAKPLEIRRFQLEPRGIEPRFAECDSAVIPLDHRPGISPDFIQAQGVCKKQLTDAMERFFAEWHHSNYILDQISLGRGVPAKWPGDIEGWS